jgi:methylthioribose-1-phosphate isomerase
MIRPVEWKNNRLILIDQTRLPEDFVEIAIDSAEQLWEAIRRLRVRGAPAIGVAAAFGVALEALRYEGSDPPGCLGHLDRVCEYLATSRPTAVNLFWALDRMRAFAYARAEMSLVELQTALLQEAREVLEEDIHLGRRLGFHGADLLRDGDTVLTHCNAGGLATGGFGTALGVIYAAREQGKRIRVYADETRPLLQGARLTAWELMRNGIEVTLICDNMAAVALRDRGIDAVIVGADRIASNGDFANKIGTYGLAVLARAHGVPFYTAAPFSSIDLALASGKEIPIEMRHGDEVRSMGQDHWTAPREVPVFNPAFDVTPAEYLTAMITEKGVARAPFRDALQRLARLRDPGDEGSLQVGN